MKGWFGKVFKIVFRDESVDCYSCGVLRVWTGITGDGKEGGF